jgi:hypothetical protein
MCQVIVFSIVSRSEVLDTCCLQHPDLPATSWLLRLAACNILIVAPYCLQHPDCCALLPATSWLLHLTACNILIVAPCCLQHRDCCALLPATSWFACNIVIVAPCCLQHPDCCVATILSKIALIVYRHGHGHDEGIFIWQPNEYWETNINPLTNALRRLITRLKSYYNSIWVAWICTAIPMEFSQIPIESTEIAVPISIELAEIVLSTNFTWVELPEFITDRSKTLSHGQLLITYYAIYAWSPGGFIFRNCNLRHPVSADW